MKKFRPAVVLIGLLASGPDSLADAPVVPGLHANHPLDERQTGALLIGELRCASCHDGMDAAHMKEAPDLAGAATRLTPGFMERFIADPSAAHPGTTMPGLLGDLPEEKRRETARAITAYLLLLDDVPPPQTPAAAADPASGREIFHSVGCVACHSPRDEAGREILESGAVPLSHLAGKYQPGALAEFLHAPLKFRPSGRMPDMKLSKEDAASLAAYLAGAPAAPAERKPADPSQIAAGREAFQTHNCTACHQPEKENLPLQMPGPALGKLDFAGGCLSETPGSAPDFHLSEVQRKAIRKALAAPAEEPAAADRIKMRLTRLNCISCHVRDDYGGVSPELDGYFGSTEEGLGNEARIPPPLTLTGAKLRPEWMDKVLHDGLGVRPYMKSRMPLFGEEGLAGLAELFGEVDQLDPIELPGPEREAATEMRNGAHLLLGDTALNCIACHNYNDKESPGMKGLDLMTSYQRLQPAWFHHFMKAPAKFRPGIIMPNYWPDGKAVQTDILDGDTNLQLRALWHNFSLGRSARDPSGLRSEPSILEVTDIPRTYRGRSNVAGYRGIAVGFPGGINYAFNAQNGALSAIWRDGFVRVGWQGQGSGNFDPIGRHLQLSEDVAFLLELATPWPPRPQVTKEQPVNPDPLYPRSHGYAFLGYSLDEDSIPTFRYRCGPVIIEDRSVAAAQADAKSLKRTFRFSAPAEQMIWFRALTGEIESESETVFKIPDLRLITAPAKTLLRPTLGAERELLIELSLPEGESTHIIEYEILR